MKALVLAAGKSTRISSVAGSLPKPLLPIAGIPVLAHNLRLLGLYGIRDIWVNLHHEPQQIRQAIGNGSSWGVTVQYSEEKEILGTAGAVKNLAKVFANEPFLVLYGDNYTDCNLADLFHVHREKKSVATVVVFDHTKSDNSGIAGGRVVTGADGNIVRFAEGEAAQKEDSPLVNAGIYAFQPEILNFIPDGFSDFGRDIFPALLKQDMKISTYTMSGFCLAVDTPEALAKTQEIAAKYKT